MTSQRQTPSDERPAAIRPQPPSFDFADCYGIVGEYVRLWAPHTEAAPVAIYACALAAIGSLIGRGPVWRFGNESHHVRIFMLLIGPSGAGRKGTTLNVGIYELLRAVDPYFNQHRRVSGLSSAEGLIAEIRDPVPPKLSPEGKTLVHGDDGVSDKRLLVVEGEMAGALEAMSREGNRLSAIVRDAWDGKDLRSMVKRDPQRATEPHIVIVGAITAPELRTLLKSTNVVNGLANRFLPVWSARSRLLADDSAPDMDSLSRITRELAHVVATARSIGSVDWAPDAASQWREEYTRLAIAEDASDTIRTLLERGAPYVRRIAFLLALLDSSRAVEVAHLDGALRLWRYVADSWRYVYHDGVTRSALADKLLAALAMAGVDGLTRTSIRENVVRSGDVPSERIDGALSELSTAGLAFCTTEATGGRPTSRWRHARYVGMSDGAGKGEKGGNPELGIGDDDLTPFPTFAAQGGTPGAEECSDEYWRAVLADAG